VTRAAAIAAYLAALLAVDSQVGIDGQRALGVLTWLVLFALLVRFPVERRAQAIGVVVFATIGEVTGSLIWGVYHYRLHNLPLFIPPAHGIVYLSGLALVGIVRARWLVVVAAVGAVGWGIAGLTVLPQLDVAGAVGVPLLCVFLWRSSSRATYAGVFLVVAALELYGTSIGTWRWATELPGLGIPDGNPPSGVASGYVWFDVMALLVASWLVAQVRKAKAAAADVGSHRVERRNDLVRDKPAFVGQLVDQAPPAPDAIGPVDDGRDDRHPAPQREEPVAVRLAVARVAPDTA